MNINFTAGMDEHPTLTELMKFGNKEINIIQEIGDRYHDFGIKLLEDKNGCKMKAIKHDERDKAESIICEVLTRWIRGEGRKPTSWVTLASVLDECKLSSLANVIRSVKATPG